MKNYKDKPKPYPPFAILDPSVILVQVNGEDISLPMKRRPDGKCSGFFGDIEQINCEGVPCLPDWFDGCDSRVLSWLKCHW